MSGTARHAALALAVFATPSRWSVLWASRPPLRTVAACSRTRGTAGVHRGIARTVFVPRLVAGAGSVAYWYWTEVQGAGDLRPYLVVQFGSLALVTLILILYPAGGSGFIVAGLAAYAAAKGLKLADREVFTALGRTLSGHTLKHLVAAAGVGCLVAMLQRRATPGWSRSRRNRRSAG